MTTTPMNEATQLREQVAQLEAAILGLHPTLPILLRTIHTQLKADPQLVTLMTEEEIGIVVSGLKRHTGIEIAAKVIKESKSATGKAKLASTTVDDL